MGGASDFPERASSPLKRRASSMETEDDTQNGDGNTDVNMTAPPSDAATSTPPSVSRPHTNGSIAQGHNEADMDTPHATALQPPQSIEAHIGTIRTLVQEMNINRLEADQECYIVSKSWLDQYVPDPSKKQANRDFSTIPRVDNSDLIWEVIDDPLVGRGVADAQKREFVRMKPGLNLDNFVTFPPEAWKLLIQWPGLAKDQPPIRRYASDTSSRQDGSNIIFEFHPPVLSIHRVWAAHSRVPVEASLKQRNPEPARLVRRGSTKYEVFLKQAKNVAKIDLHQRVRGWQIHPQGKDQDAAVWNHLLVDVEAFAKLERGAEKECIEFGDLTTGSVKTLHSLGISQDMPIVLDPHEEGTEWTSTYVPSGEMTLPTRSSATNLAVQNQSSRGGRASPAPTGPMTRGRSTKSGRTIGCVGLTNLGNTCYMNAALQCVRSVEELTKYFLVGEWEKELNKDNILAHNGEVAATYAALLRDIYKDSAPSATTPRQFKHTIGRHAAQFSGYGQQDSQEFLGFLLDGLQEDLSRVKKKPYIEKPDSTDEMIHDPEAIRKMADEVWDIMRKRDDSVIADLFTGLYKSTLVCPACDKVSITFDPFNNLTLQLPVGNKWSHVVKFFPLNDKPVDIRVEIEKHDSIKALKQFISARTGVPAERLHSCEEWSKKFYKHHLDNNTASDEISSPNDHVFVYELEAKPTNYPGKAIKQQKYRSMLDTESAPVNWDDEEAESLLVPVFHRKPNAKKSYQTHKLMAACIPHFIMLTPQEARSEDIIRRKVLEKVATFTKHPWFVRSDDSDGSETTEPEMIGPNGSDTGSSIEGKVVAQSIRGEDDLVDVQMKDATDAKNSSASRFPQPSFNRKKPVWMDHTSFLPSELQNLFEIGICGESSSPIPTGSNANMEDKDYPRLSSRAVPDSPSSEEQLDNATTSTASNDDSSSDEVPRTSVDMGTTRMNDESDDGDGNPVVKVPSTCSLRFRTLRIMKIGHRQHWLTARHQSLPHRPKQSRPSRTNNKAKRGKKGKSYGKKGSKRAQQAQREQKDLLRKKAMDFEDFTGVADPVPDGGPLVRLKEGLVVDWSEDAYDNVFGADTTLETWENCDTLADPDLEKAQAARARRRKHGVTLEECLDEFERDEVLSEQDMWYCPRCKEHRRASKKLDLWKSPDILICHLKRFSSSGFRRDKLETLVEFPIENLDITSRVLQIEEGKQEIYDLIGVDCHFGGLGGGHYTAYGKNFVDGQWYSYNDSSVSKINPERIVDSSAYMLFYRRRSSVPLGGPRFAEILQRFTEAHGSDEEMSKPGEGRRLGEGSSQIGSSSAIPGVGATHLPGNHSSSKLSYEADDDMQISNASYQSGQMDEDEGIGMTEDTKTSGFQGFANLNTWSFDGVTNENSPIDSGAASDEAQHDSSGDERASSRRLSVDGMLEYTLPPQPEGGPPSYNELPAPVPRQWGTQHAVHEIVPNGEHESQSDDAAEIHLDDDDKIRV
ncbi:hypothetical protein F5Y18DRAFT_336069 [Xylariaceae sp. FL1019]|nr:hypothetical protein F5Y18DRAFT_336069 [Xylariaceae sp. FL1019]